MNYQEENTTKIESGTKPNSRYTSKQCAVSPAINFNMPERPDIIAS